jgi:hypothetical protein
MPLILSEKHDGVNRNQLASKNHDTMEANWVSMRTNRLNFDEIRTTSSPLGNRSAAFQYAKSHSETVSPPK